MVIFKAFSLYGCYEGFKISCLFNYLPFFIELSKGDVPSINEEDMVLIQAIQSIKVIIIKDPSKHEKVIFIYFF